ncbi:MAG: hypothetical protein QM753_05130 [Thermomicrobiales bacterium]
MTDDATQVNEVSRGEVVVLSGDLFFGMRIRTTLKGMGFTGRLVTAAPAFDEAIGADGVVLGIVDFNRPVDWDVVSPAARSVPVVAFGAHTDVDGFRAAKEAGVARVISNGSFSEQLPALLERYAKPLSS